MAFKNMHSLHGLIIGVMVGLYTRSPVAGVVTGVALYAYMAKFGHGLPTMTSNMHNSNTFNRSCGNRNKIQSCHNLI